MHHSSILPRLSTTLFATAALSICALRADDESPTTLQLEDARILATGTVQADPVHTFASPVSALRFEPFVEVQARNFTEAQSDVSLRGSTFESTGFAIGPVTLIDPQTGHYFAEIPIPARMLGSPRLLWGADNALHGFNATAGTIRWDWNRIRSGGEATAGWGNHSLNAQSLYLAQAVPEDHALTGLGVDVEAARSESSGAVENGDHEFERIAGRLQWWSTESQSDLFVGYQSKFFGWPNLYAAPFNSNEAENLQTTLALARHQQQLAHDGMVEVAGYFRRNKDDYDFDRFNPGQGNPFQHETQVWAAAIEGMQPVNDLRIRYHLHGAADTIESTALTFREQSRSTWKAGLAPEMDFFPGGDRILTARAGLTYDDSNRFSGRISPLVEFALEEHLTNDLRWNTRLGYSESTQIPGYTATNSAPGAGLFRGNQSLGRELARQVDWFNTLTYETWEIQANVFHRWDENLTDWTFTRDRTTARTANPIDTRTLGTELLVARRFGDTSRPHGWGRVSASYAYLTKSFDYGDALVDASFYALNYPRHRGTVSLIYRFLPSWEIRGDNEAREQAPNFLRQSSNTAIRTNASLAWIPAQLSGFTLEASVDNLWEDDFEEVPGVPPTGRQYRFTARYSW